jgi:integrase
MPSANNTPTRRRSSKSFRIGKVWAFLRGQVWYLCYYEQGRRLQPRVGPDRAAAQKMAAEVNAQLEVGLPSALGFELISFSELQLRCLEHHENVRRSSIRMIERYRAATHTRPETKRRQLEAAMRDRPAQSCADKWLTRQHLG